MDAIIYLVGLVVIVMAILSLVGLRRASTNRPAWMRMRSVFFAKPIVRTWLMK